MENNWTPVSRELPPLMTDVLIYSAKAKGYAVGVTNGSAWNNSTTGQPFPPNTVTHWMPLPDPPTMALAAVPRYEGYSN